MLLISKYELEVKKLIEAKQRLNEIQNLKKRFWLKRGDQKNNISRQSLRIKNLLDQMVLEILLTRDAIHTLLSESNPTCQELLKLTAVDEQYKTLTGSSEWSDQVSRIRASFKPEIEEKFWWWFPEDLSKPTRLKKRSDWLLKLITNIIWVVSLSILIDISSKIIAGNPDLLGISAVVFNAFLALLVSKGILTGTNSWIEYQLDSLDIAQKYERCIQLGLAVVILILSIMIHHDLRIISVLYFNKAEAVYVYHQNNQEFGVQSQELNAVNTQTEEDRFFAKIEKGLIHLSTQLYRKLIGNQSQNAQADYYRATKLDPKNWKAHNRLGEIYEDQEDLSQAVISYRVAAKGNLPASLINLSRHYILKENSEKSERPYLIAVGLLIKTDSLIDQKGKQLRQKGIENSRRDPEIFLDEYNRRFHQAWAYLKMAKISDKKDDKLRKLNLSMYLTDEAINHFETSNPSISSVVISRNFAHCIRAETIDIYQEEGESIPEKYDGIKDSRDDWEQCTSTIANLKGVLRPYEAGWWTQAKTTF
jgi:tetratricopeptide (TPR) repeat protein